MIILNFMDEIQYCFIENGAVQYVIKTNSFDNHPHCTFANEEYILLKNNDSLFCIDTGTLLLAWEHPMKLNAIYRFIGVIQESAFLLELIDDRLFLYCFSLQSGDVRIVENWDVPLRIDCVETSDSIDIAILYKNGTSSIMQVCSTSFQSFDIKYIHQEIPLITSPVLEKCLPSVEVEVNSVGFRLLKHHNQYFLLNSITTNIADTKSSLLLTILCLDEDESSVWKQTLTSMKSANSIVEDAFLQDDFLVLQFPYQKPDSMKFYHCIWMDTKNGGVVQSFYEDILFWSETCDQGLKFLPYTIIFTSTPGSDYISAIAGYSWFKTGFFKIETTPMQFNNVDVEKRWEKSFDSEYASALYSPFEYNSCICFFAWYHNEELGRWEWEVSLFSYDMATKTEKPPIVFEDFVGFSNYAMLLKGDVLTTAGHHPRKDGYYLVSYDLSTGKTLWKKEIDVVSQIGDRFLTVKKTESYTEYSLFDGITGNHLWDFQFKESDVYFCGVDARNMGYFYRENAIVSQINLQDGSLLDEIFLSYPYGSNICVKENYMIFQIEQQAFQCLFLPTKQVIWTKNLKEYSSCFMHETFYSASWIGQMISEKEMISYDNEGIILFDIHTGTPTKRFQVDPYKIEYIHRISNTSFILELKDDENQLFPSIIQIELSDLTSGIVYKLPEKKEIYRSEYLHGFFTHRGECFIVQRIPESTYRIVSATTLEVEKNLEPIYLEPHCSNFLYYDDYIIFQASLGTRNSNWYLLAFSIIDGSITPIHKGIHEKFFIHNNLLYFIQYGCYYSTPFEEFNPTRTEYSFADPQFRSETGDFSLPSYQESIPDEFSVLDLYYINQVLQGKFTQPDLEETLFLTGDGYHSKVGIMDKKNQKYIPLIHGSLEFTKILEEEPSLFPFWQSKINDIDDDGLDEIIAIGFMREWGIGNACVYIWDFSEDDQTMVPYKVLERKNVGDPELIIQNGAVYFRYFTYDADYNKNQKLRKLVFEPSNRRKYTLELCDESVETQLYAKPEIHSLQKFQFLENPVTSEEKYVELKKNTTKGFPFVEMPQEFVISSNTISDGEIRYIEKRNYYLDRFLFLLDRGIDPFKGISVTLYGFSDSRTYTVELQTDEKFEWKENTIPINSLETFLLIREGNHDYVVIRAIDVWDGRHIFLFSDKFDFLDVFSYGGNGAEYDADAIVSLNHPDHFWLYTPMYRSPCRLCIMQVTNGLLYSTMRFGYFQLFQKDREPYFMMEDYFLYVDGMGRHSHIDGYHYIDPWSGEFIDQFFLKEMERQFDYLYSCYLYYRSFVLTPGKIPRAGGSYLQLEDKRIKPLFTTNACYILEYFEWVFYHYGFIESSHS